MVFRDLFDKKTWLPDWDKIFSINEFNVMEACKQSKTWHGEGNVMNHTKLVANAMLSYLTNRLEIFPSNNEYYIMMMAAAICHDLGKPSTTVFDREKDDWTTKCHGVEGARITRRLFFDEDVVLREKVCYMVRHHMDLHHIFDNEERSTRSMITLSQGRVTVKDMIILNFCDSMGSHNTIETEDDIENKHERQKNLAKMLDCLDKPYAFNSEYEKICFFRDRDALKPEHKEEYEKATNDDNFTMYVMISVPGGGKSTYIDYYLNDVVDISRDIIRTEIGLKGEKTLGNKAQEDKVTEIFNKRVIECCKQRKSFVIDNTNVRKKYRDGYTDMVLPYAPKIKYVYVEAPDLETYKKRREGMMPLNVIDRMWSQFDFPEATEYNELIIQKQI